jgi:Ca2+-binding EF-hand superfamily protein
MLGRKLNIKMGNSETKTELSEEDIAMLIANTGFDRDRILIWFEQFKSECVDGKLDKKAFIKFYNALLPNTGIADDFSILVFKAFDKDDSKYIGKCE